MLKLRLKLFLVKLQYLFYCLLHFLHLKSTDKLAKHKKRGISLSDQIEAIASIQKRLEFYFQNKKTQNSKVVYTCIVGDYDNLIDYLELNPEYDYICFTNNQTLLEQNKQSVWQIRPLAYHNSEPSLTNRYHKLHPHLLLAEYSESLYIDANVWLKSNKIYNCLDALKTDTFLAIPHHHKRNCLYAEMQVCLDFRLENAENIDKLQKFYTQEKFPQNYGLTENNIIYRKHHNPKCLEIMQDWWFMLQNYSKRDQLSLFYVLYKHNLPMDYLQIEPRNDLTNFQILGHKK